MSKSGHDRQSCIMRLFLKEFNSGFKIYCDVSGPVELTSTDGALCQSITLVARLTTGQIRVIGKHSELCQSTYYVSKTHTVRFQKSCTNLYIYFLLIKAIMKKICVVTFSFNKTSWWTCKNYICWSNLLFFVNTEVISRRMQAWNSCSSFISRVERSLSSGSLSLAICGFL